MIDTLVENQTYIALFGLLFLIATAPIWNKTLEWKRHQENFPEKFKD